MALQREVEALLAASAGSGLVDRLADADGTSRVLGARAGGRLGRLPRRTVRRARTARRRRDGPRLQGARTSSWSATSRSSSSRRISAHEAARKSALPGRRRAPPRRSIIRTSARSTRSAGPTTDSSFIAMPLYDGETLQARLARGRARASTKRPRSPSRSRAGSRTRTGEASSTATSSRRTSCCSRDGTVKILDFGIATDGRPVADRHRATASARSPT